MKINCDIIKLKSKKNLIFSNKCFIEVYCLFFFLISSFIFFKEIYSFKNSINQISFMFFKQSCFFLENSSTFSNFFSNVNSSLIIQKPHNSMFLFLVVLKFFHLILIFLLSVLFLTKSITSFLSQENLSLLKINLNYVLFFYIVNFFIFLKPLFQFFFLKNYFFNFSFSNISFFGSLVIEFLNNLL